MDFWLKMTVNKLARDSKPHHNQAVKTVGRPSRLGGWSVRCVSVVLALAFCASAFASDPSKNVVVRSQPQPTINTTKKMCYVVEGDSRIPQPCERISAIPTTANSMKIFGIRTGK